MKTMTCKQLHGPCDVLIHGETSDEMMENSQKHGMEMAAKGDIEHLKVMEEMRQSMDDPEKVRQFMEKFQSDFENLPEDE